MYTPEQMLEAIEKCLTADEQEILKTRFGLGGGIPVPLPEINKIYGVTNEQVREMEKRVFRYLRSYYY